LFAATITAGSAGTAGNAPAAADAYETLIFNTISEKKSPYWGILKVTVPPNCPFPD